MRCIKDLKDADGLLVPPLKRIVIKGLLLRDPFAVCLANDLNRKLADAWAPFKVTDEESAVGFLGVLLAHAILTDGANPEVMWELLMHPHIRDNGHVCQLLEQPVLYASYWSHSNAPSLHHVLIAGPPANVLLTLRYAYGTSHLCLAIYWVALALVLDDDAAWQLLQVADVYRHSPVAQPETAEFWLRLWDAFLHPSNDGKLEAARAFYRRRDAVISVGRRLDGFPEGTCNFSKFQAYLVRRYPSRTFSREDLKFRQRLALPQLLALGPRYWTWLFLPTNRLAVLAGLFPLPQALRLLFMVYSEDLPTVSSLLSASLRVNLLSEKEVTLATFFFDGSFQAVRRHLGASHAGVQAFFRLFFGLKFKDGELDDWRRCTEMLNLDPVKLFAQIEHSQSASAKCLAHSLLVIYEHFSASYPHSTLSNSPGLLFAPTSSDSGSSFLSTAPSPSNSSTTNSSTSLTSACADNEDAFLRVENYAMNAHVLCLPGRRLLVWRSNLALYQHVINAHWSTEQMITVQEVDQVDTTMTNKTVRIMGTHDDWLYVFQVHCPSDNVPVPLLYDFALWRHHSRNALSIPLKRGGFQFLVLFLNYLPYTSITAILQYHQRGHSSPELALKAVRQALSVLGAVLLDIP